MAQSKQSTTGKILDAALPGNTSPRELLQTALSPAQDFIRAVRGENLSASTSRFIPSAPPVDPRDAESLDVWGFADTKFVAKPNGAVELSGSRYSVSGQELPSLLPWIRSVMNVPLDANEVHAPKYPPQIPPAVVSAAFTTALKDFLSPAQMTDDGEQRLRRGHGHTQEEMYAIKYGVIPRVPDLVIFPENEEEVAAIVRAAVEHDICLIPYGGGTNVTDALRCNTSEKRMIVSVDMRRMNRIVWIDPVNRMACIEAGAVGRHITTQLAEHGLTMGHEPDSIEFSTLGGWIATNASGMKKNKYGNIEDIVLDIHAVTPKGVLRRSTVAPRESIGMDARQLFLGSEGKLGIITSAVVKLYPVPEVQKYGSILFKTFESGVAFMYELTQANAQPASVRLVDNLQFQFGMALKPASTGARAVKSKLEKFVVTKLKGFDPNQMTACTLVFEGTAKDVAAQEAEVYEIGARHGGMKAGVENGKRGYQLTYGIAYIRDFVMNHHVIAESFETSVPWTQVLSLCENVKRRLYDEYAKRNLPGRPFVTCRVTQVYETGVAVYFYFGYYHKGVANPSQVYAELEHIAREEILAQGGSLSHHHGVGKLRQNFLPEIMSPASLAVVKSTKRAIDPTNVFGVANQEPTEEVTTTLRVQA